HQGGGGVLGGPDLGQRQLGLFGCQYLLIGGDERAGRGGLRDGVPTDGGGGEGGLLGAGFVRGHPPGAAAVAAEDRRQVMVFSETGCGGRVGGVRVGAVVVPVEVHGVADRPVQARVFADPQV